MADKSFHHDYIAGAIGGAAGVVVGHPFDTVKVQLQVSGGKEKYAGIVDCIKSVRAQSLSNGFFRGLSWPLLWYGTINSIFFGVYGSSLSMFGYSGEDANDGTSRYYMSVLGAGALAGMAQLPLATPVETIKVLLQSEIPHQHGATIIGIQKSKHYHKGPITATADILRTRGATGLFRGFGTQFFRDVPASGVYMTIFEVLTATGTTSAPRVPSQVVNFLSGGVAGVVSWLLILPLDVVKSRLQADPERERYRGFWHCASSSYKEEGARVFFRGALVMSARAFPVNAITLMVYAECLVLLTRNRDERS